MKPIFLLVSIALLFSSCVMISELEVLKDDIKNTRSAYLTIENMTIEEDAWSISCSQKMIKEITEDGTGTVIIYFTFRATTDSYGIDNKYYIKIADKVHEYTIDKVNRSAKSATSSSTRQVYKPSTGISSGNTASTGHWDTVTDVHTSSWNEYTFSIGLEPEVVNEILSNNQCTIRFYSANTPISLIYTEESFAALKSVLEYK